MSRLYTVGLIKKSQMRDIQLEIILDDNFNSDDYIHDCDFSYVFEYNNMVSDTLTTSTKVYKTLNGAKRFRDKLKYSPNYYNLKYPIKDDLGNWYHTTKNDYSSVVIDITKKWDNLIDNIIQKRNLEFEKEILKLNSMKSKK